MDLEFRAIYIYLYVLENQFGLEKAKESIKIDRVHRLGIQIYYPDKERILANARKRKAGFPLAIFFARSDNFLLSLSN